MSRSLRDLSREFYPKACELIALCTNAGIPVLIVDTLRTREEQEANIAKGVSWTLNSKHLTGNAIDIAPYDVYQLAGYDKLKWDPKDPVWQRIGIIGESLDLVWGGRWKQKDLGHFELKFVTSNQGVV